MVGVEIVRRDLTQPRPIPRDDERRVQRRVGAPAIRFERQPLAVGRPRRRAALRQRWFERSNAPVFAKKPDRVVRLIVWLAGVLLTGERNPLSIGRHAGHAGEHFFGIGQDHSRQRVPVDLLDHTLSAIKDGEMRTVGVPRRVIHLVGHPGHVQLPRRCAIGVDQPDRVLVAWRDAGERDEIVSRRPVGPRRGNSNGRLD